MKGIYLGIYENLDDLNTVIGALTILEMSVVTALNSLIDDNPVISALNGIQFEVFWVVFLLLLIMSYTPCGFKADETGFTMSALGIFRRRYQYDDIANVTIDSHRRLENNRRKVYYVTVLVLIVTERSGNKRAYAQRCLPSPDGQDESRLPKLIKLYNYIQSQMGRPAYKEQYTPVQPARPLVIMTGRSADAAEIGEEK